MEQIDLSIVVPVYNEEENLRPLLAEITAALADQHLDYEVIFVDDGSSDGSFELLKTLHEENGRVVVVPVFAVIMGRRPLLPPVSITLRAGSFSR
jgi:glycosyltransferase involved in cell wall biosynthesis